MYEQKLTSDAWTMALLVVIASVCGIFLAAILADMPDLDGEAVIASFAFAVLMLLSLFGFFVVLAGVIGLVVTERLKKAGLAQQNNARPEPVSSTAGS